jgi:Mycolic acid cyclopropane synthetase
LYPTGKETLEQAEVAMLESYVVKAGLMDGMDLLDLGCGWGSLSIFLAEVYISLSEWKLMLEIPWIKSDRFIKQSLAEIIYRFANSEKGN